MTNAEYSKFADQFAPRSKLLPNMLRAFLFGGLICCIGQAFNQIYTCAGLEKDAARMYSIGIRHTSAAAIRNNVLTKVKMRSPLVLSISPSRHPSASPW